MAESKPPATTQTSQSEQEAKRVEYYGAMVNGWLDTKMERDKTIVQLATGGVGLLVTLLTTVGANSPTAATLYGVAIGGFVVAITSAIAIFTLNADYLKAVVKKEEPGKGLGRLDNVMLLGFALGLASSILIGVCDRSCKNSSLIPELATMSGHEESRLRRSE